LSLVVLDKLPFPRPDDPLLEARREAVGRDTAFGQIDLPIAATSLAQAAGRLIRTAEDKGVVAVLDRRLATAGYWKTLIAAMPPMARTRDRAEIEQFLRDITTAQ
jgi:ATP-dependent DNA helicase DinG